MLTGTLSSCRSDMAILLSGWGIKNSFQKQQFLDLFTVLIGLMALGKRKSAIEAKMCCKKFDAPNSPIIRSVAGAKKKASADPAHAL
ncbi:hypothetical protein Syncc9605_1414 [Synechococcus sp. CC9605]|nr:hypothetical protein Syncc9605_1414 [Synechococcus sp. CC9605]